jgi:hypothetical protein
MTDRKASAIARWEEVVLPVVKVEVGRMYDEGKASLIFWDKSAGEYEEG